MRKTPAARSSLDALDQWGIEFVLPPEDLAQFAESAPRTLARAVSYWRLTIPTLLPKRRNTLDQWGIEFPLSCDELASFGGTCWGERSQALASAILTGRLHGMYRFGAYAAILAVLVAGSVSAVPSVAEAGLPLITSEPAAISATAATPTLPATPYAEALVIKPVSTVPAPAVPEVLTVEIVAIPVPSIQDARKYLVARLGARVDRHWGRSQSQCASLIFEYESNWDPHATNKSSGAYGLPQANPASKLANWAESRARAKTAAGDLEAAWLYRSWRDNPVVQAEWGVDYMNTRYGSACAALAFRYVHGWY